MNPMFYFSILQPFYILLVPATIFTVFIMLFIPSMMFTTNPRPEAIGRAIACYILKAFGLILIGIAAIPVLYNLLVSSLLPLDTMLGLALVFVVGLGILVQANIILGNIDDASVAVPRAIFHHACEVLGALTAVTSGLAVMIAFLESDSNSGWQVPASLLIVGLILMISFSLHTKPRRRDGFASKAVVAKKK